MSSSRIPSSTSFGGHKERSTSSNLPKNYTRANAAILKPLTYDALDNTPSQLARIGGIYVKPYARELPLTPVQGTSVYEGVYKRERYVAKADHELAFNPPLHREVRGPKKSVWV